MKNKIFELIIKVTDNSDLDENARLLDEGWLDSLSTIILIQEIEESFQIEINSDYLNHENFNTLSNITNLVQKIFDEKNIKSK